MLTGGRPERMFAERLRQAIDHSQAILDIGTNQRFAKELRPYELWFSGKQYIAAGYCPPKDHGRYNCDSHQDIEQMTFEDSSFDTVICLEVLEHVANPFQAVKEIKRVLRPGGYLILTVPFMAQYHGKGSSSQCHEGYPDLWSFTHEGLQRLFGDFRLLELVPLDGPIEFRLKQFYCSHFLRSTLIRKILDAIDHPQLGKATSRHLAFGIK